MKVAVMGAGAVGCCYGAWLAEAGAEVVLIGRPALAEAVAARGLTFESGGTTRQIPMQAATEASGAAGADLVLVCVKLRDTAEAGAALLPHLGPDTTLLSLQNGIAGARLLAEATGRPAVPAAVYVAAGMAGPGHVQHMGRGELIIGPCPASAAIVAEFAKAGVPVEVSEAVETAQWTKLAANCAFNALSAITRMPYGLLVRQPGVDEVMTAVLDEVRAVAAAEGVPLPESVHGVRESIPRTMAGQFSSTAQDIMSGRPTEIDWLNGEIVRRGAAHGIPTPANLTLLTLVRALDPASMRE